MRTAFLVGFAAAFLVPCSAFGQTFGEAGQFVVSGGTQLSAQHTSFSAPSGVQQPGATTSIVVAPSADLFVLRGLSVGARISYQHSELAAEPPTGNLSINALQFGPRVGFNLTLNEHLSLWPSVSAAFGHTWYGSGSDSDGIALGADVPLVAQLVPHFFVGLGPNVLTYVTSKTSTSQGSTDAPRMTEYGIALTMGGWIDS
jgi:hypothetical protein